VCQPREDLQRLVLVGDFRPLVVINNCLIPRELGVHVEPTTLPRSQADWLGEVQLAVIDARRLMISLVNEFPELLLVLLVPVGVNSCPYRERSKVSTHRDSIDLYELNWRAALHTIPTPEVEHDPAERVVLMVTHVH